MITAEMVSTQNQNYVRKAVRKVVRPQDIDDMVQEAFARAVEKIDRLEHDNFPAWVAKIAVGLANNERHRHRNTRPHFGDDAIYKLLAPEQDRGITRELEYALGVLSPKQLSVLYAIADGYSYEECAELFAIPLGTVMTRLLHARRKIRAILGR